MTRPPKDEGPTLFVQSLPGSFSDLGPLGREVSLDPGAALWKEGDPGDHVVLLIEGRLEERAALIQGPAPSSCDSPTN